MLRPMTRGLLALTLFLTACTAFPELDGKASETAKAAPFPKLQPMDQLLAAGAEPPRLTDADVNALLARVQRLKARANRLRGPVVDRATRIRMQGALAR